METSGSFCRSGIVSKICRGVFGGLRTGGLAALFLTSGAVVAAQAEPPKVVASIKPVHSLVAKVMGDIGEPSLIVEGVASPHNYSLKPSQAQLLQDSDIVFWVGPLLESFLRNSLETLADDAITVSLIDADGLTVLPVRTGARFEAHDHGDHGGHDDHAHGDHDHDHAKDEHAHDDHGEEKHAHDDHDHDKHEEAEHKHSEDGHSDHADHDHDHDHAKDEHAHDNHDHDHAGAADNHIWLDPENAGVMLDVIAKTLSDTDPENAGTYTENAAEAKAELEALQMRVAEKLKPVLSGDGRFIVFHDAYQYFENRFGLTATGAISIDPEVMPGAKRIGEIKETIQDLSVTCVFYEPQFNPSIVAAVSEGTKVRQGLIDPLGSNLAAGSTFYGELLEQMAGSFVDCLGRES